MKISKNSNGEISTILVLFIIVIILGVVFVIRKNSVTKVENQKAQNYIAQSQNIQNLAGTTVNNASTSKVDPEVSNLGVKDMNNTDDKIVTFNEQFETYKGNVTGTKVKSLLATVVSQNSINKGVDVSKVVNVKSVGLKDVNDNVNDTNNLSKIKIAIDTNKQYKVEFEKNNDGYISTIIITAL